MPWEFPLAQPRLTGKMREFAWREGALRLRRCPNYKETRNPETQRLT